MDREERKKKRQDHVKPLVEAYFAWVKEQMPKTDPCYEVTIVKRRLQEISVSGKPHLYFSDSVWKEL